MPDAQPAESPSAFDATTATLLSEPFCEEVDATLVAGALRMPADEVALLSQRVVDQERPGTEQRAGSVVNSCTFGSDTQRLVVAVQPEEAEAAVRRRVDGYRDGRRGDGCQVTDDPWFGTPGVVVDCADESGIRSVAVVGLVGGSGFFCSAAVDAAGPDVLEATVEVCRDTVESLGVPD